MDQNQPTPPLKHNKMTISSHLRRHRISIFVPKFICFLAYSLDLSSCICLMSSLHAPDGVRNTVHMGNRRSIQQFILRMPLSYLLLCHDANAIGATNSNCGDSCSLNCFEGILCKCKEFNQFRIANRTIV